MNNWWVKTCLFLSATVLIINFPTTASATAPVFCVNCGTEATQLLSKLTAAKQLATQAQQLQSQLRMYADMATNSKTVSQSVWGSTVSDFQKLNNLFLQSKALAGNASNLDGQFAQRYGTYTSYIKNKMSGSDWNNKYSQWSSEASDNARYTLKGIGVQASQMQNEQLVMQQLQNLSQSAQGRMQAVQVANMFASQNMEQLMKLRQLLMSQMQMQANYMAQEQDRKAASDAAVQRFYNFQPLQYKGGKSY
jgi:P-type conjugative transfer protein TrbJ